MKQLITISIIFFLTSNTIAQFGVKPKKIEEVFIRLDKLQDYNKGSAFEYSICARLKNGKIKELNKSNSLTVDGEGLEREGRSKLLILKSNDCTKEYFKFSYRFSKGDFLFEGEDSIQLNYKGPVICKFISEDGKDGNKGEKRNLINNSLRFVDGTNGENGGNGESGAKGCSLKTFIRKDSVSDLILIDVINLDDDKRYCFKTTSLSNGVTFNISGGNGGNGGDGNSGQNGKDEKQKNNGKIRKAGNGGHGSNGGNGGFGGNGGEVLIYLHESLRSYVPSLKINNYGGLAGNSGKGANGGSGGKNLNGSITTTAGKSGLVGTKGGNGIQGSVNQIIFISDQYFSL